MGVQFASESEDFSGLEQVCTVHMSMFILHTHSRPHTSSKFLDQHAQKDTWFLGGSHDSDREHLPTLCLKSVGTTLGASGDRMGQGSVAGIKLPALEPNVSAAGYFAEHRCGP